MHLYLTFFPSMQLFAGHSNLGTLMPLRALVPSKPVLGLPGLLLGTGLQPRVEEVRLEPGSRAVHHHNREGSGDSWHRIWGWRP